MRLSLDSTGARVIGAILIAVLLFVLGSLLIPGYSSAFSIRAMLVLACLLAVACVGQTLTIILGGIDLSIPFVIGFANVVAAQLYGDGMNFVLVCLIVGVLALGIGALNGLISAGLGLHPLIVTLGIGTIIQGAVLVWTRGFPSGSAPEAVTKFVSIGGSVEIPGLGALPVPWLIPAFAIPSALIILVLNRTPYGRRLFALGSNPKAAALALIDPLRMWMATYALSALFAATAGVLLLGFTGSAYGDVGQPYLFQTIAAVVIGGAALGGSRGPLLGPLPGAGVVAEVKTVPNGPRPPPSMVQAALGLVILVLVSLYGREAHVRNTV